MTGWLAIAGLGPGDPDLVTPEVTAALAQATDVIGYVPYVARVAARDGLTLHPSDNRVELDRAGHALRLADEGRRVVVVSSGDPGVFAMAAAVFEALEAGPTGWRTLDIRVLPGITAMLAASARAGAPLGHDFCAINLSDNLKPWGTIERRIRLAAEADFAIAFYNPRSKARPDTLDDAFAVLRASCRDVRPVLFARAVSTPDEVLAIVPLPDASGAMADMRTMVIVGSSQTRIIARPVGPILYTPRSAS
jgi:precorrin-3B C17-methyltransferase